MVLLLQQGLPAWIAAVEQCVPPSRWPASVSNGQRMVPTDADHSLAVAVTLPRDVLPCSQYPEVTWLLAGLVLSARPGFCRFSKPRDPVLTPFSRPFPPSV